MSSRGLVFLVFCVLAACSSEGSDTLGDHPETNGMLDGGNAEVPGDDASIPELDAATPELDASMSDAALPPRSALTLAGGTLERCAQTTLAITWQGEASLPPLGVSGVPEGVAYSLTPDGDNAALLTLSADRQLALDSAFTITMQGGDGATGLEASAQVAVPATYSVRARVLDHDGLPAAAATLTLNENLIDPPLVSDAQGEAVIAGLDGPYDLFVVPTPAGPNKEAIDYRGLTRCDPTFVNQLTPVYRSAQLAGTITPPAAQTFDDGFLLVGGLGLGRATFDPVSAAAASDFTFTPRWFGQDTFGATLEAVWVRPGLLFAAAGSLPFNAESGVPQAGLTLPLGAGLATRAHTVQAEIGGYDAGRAFVALSAFDTNTGRIENLHPGNSPDLGAFVITGTSGTLATTIPAGNTVLVLDVDDPFGGGATDTKALALAPAAAGSTTFFTMPATPLLEDVTLMGDYRAEPATFSWAAVAGADAIIIDLPSSVRAVLPGDATSYTTDLALARSVAPDDCVGEFHVSAVFLEGYDADADADGSGRHVPRESSDFGEGPGHLAGRDTAVVYSWHFYACS
jgi:hypothetical protein